MRRPLLTVCLCLVAIAAIRCGLYGSGGGKEEFLRSADGQALTVTGRVYQKDTQTFSIEPILIRPATTGPETIQPETIQSNTIQPNTIQSETIQPNTIPPNITPSAATHTGVIRSDVIRSDAICSDAIRSDAAASQQSVSVTGNLICKWADNPQLSAQKEEIRLGSTVTLTGTLRCFPQASNPGESDMAEYYRTLHVAGRLTDAELLSQNNRYSPVKETLYRWRTYFRNRLYAVFPQKEASVMCAMLLGDKSGLDSEIREKYQRNGIVHILSISGLHITIIGMGIYKLLRRAGLPVWMAALVGGIVLGGYGMMTGMSVSACRAIGMYLLRMLSLAVGRTYDMLTSLGVLAVLMTGWNPLYLRHAGFLLSFASILGVGVLYPALLPSKVRIRPQRYEGRSWKVFADKLFRSTGQRLIQSILAGTSITLATLPIQLWFYYEIPVYSILLNLLVLPLMGIVMATGLVAMLLPGMGIAGTITCLILSGYEWLCGWFDRLPFHTWNPGRPQIWQVMVYYLILFMAVIVSMGKKRIIPRILCMTMAVMIFSLKYPLGSTVTFLDVGQGDCIFVRTASGEVFLFDCGSSSRSQVGKYILLPFLKYHGIQRIDAVFVSHPDADHCNGIRELFAMSGAEDISIGELVLPAIDEEAREEAFSSLIQAAEQSGEGTPAGIRYIRAGDRLNMEGGTFTCLHPLEGYGSEDTNAYSECFYIELYGKKGEGDRRTGAVTLLLTGDVEGEGEELLLQELKNRDIGNITVLKVAHHGSRNSTGEELLAQLKPSVSVISCGQDNGYGHPHEELLERLENSDTLILKTFETGAVTVQCGGKQVRIRLTFPRSSYHSSVRF